MIVVSLTTTPARNGTLGQTLDSLRGQTRPPDEIRVYLAGGAAAPVGAQLEQLEGWRAPLYPPYPGTFTRRVRWLPCADHGPVTKLAAVLDDRLPADATVVTVDDDQSYAPQWLEVLERGTQLGGAAGFSGWNVSSMLGDQAGGFVYPPAAEGFARGVDVLEGFAGVAYRREWFDASVLDVPEPFRLVDDVWISAQLAARGIKRRVLGRPMLLRHYGKQPGIHDRPDFLALNRAAVRAWFGEAGMVP